MILIARRLATGGALGKVNLSLACWLLAAALLAASGAAGAAEDPPAVLADLPSLGEPGARLVDLATRPGVRQRLLLLRPARVQASLILFVGGDGRLNLDQNYALSTNQGNFLKRIARRLAGQGFLIALVDQAVEEGRFFNSAPLRTSAGHAQDMAGVIAFLRQEAPAPVWLVGTSMGTISAANVAIRLGPRLAQGLVLSSTVMGGGKEPGIFSLDLEEIRQPVLVIHHRQDGCPSCPYQQTGRLLRDLEKAPVKELLTFQGGRPDISGPCEALSSHGFYGVEDEVALALAAWIKAQSPQP